MANIWDDATFLYCTHAKADQCDNGGQIKGRANIKCFNGFDALWLGCWISELYWSDEQHSSIKYSLIWWFDDGSVWHIAPKSPICVQLGWYLVNVKAIIWFKQFSVLIKPFSEPCTDASAFVMCFHFFIQGLPLICLLSTAYLLWIAFFSELWKSLQQSALCRIWKGNTDIANSKFDIHFLHRHVT